jgi:hypothetical protein
MADLFWGLGVDEPLAAQPMPTAIDGCWQSDLLSVRSTAIMTAPCAKSIFQPSADLSLVADAERDLD